MKHGMLVWVLMVMCGFTIVKTAVAQPNLFTIECTGHDASFQQTDPNKVQVAPHFNGSVQFQIAAGAGVHLKTDTITWSHPPAGGGNDPSWGAWTVSSSKTNLNWSPPTGASASGDFRVSVNGKFTCGSGNGGGEYSFSGYWDGNLNRDWEANPAIDSSLIGASLYRNGGYAKYAFIIPAHPGEMMSFNINSIVDKDTHKGADPSDVTDTTKPVVWSDSSSSSASNFSGPHDFDNTAINPMTHQPYGISSDVTWTVPALDKLSSGASNEGWVQITAIIDDEAPPVGENESGSRDDKPREVKFLVNVTGPKHWTRAEDENLTTNISAKITKPVEVKIGDPIPTINAKAGDAIMVSVEGSDVDYWTRSAPSPISGESTTPIGINRYGSVVWTAKSNGEDYGEFSEKNPDDSIKTTQVDNSTTYHIPPDAAYGTNIIVTAHANDHKGGPEGPGDELPPGDSGNRDDDPIELSFNIKISKEPDIQSIELTPENPITSGYQNSPAAALDFNATISDPESKVTSVNWSWGNQTYTGNPWHIDAVPYDMEHGPQSVTCTIHWEDNGTAESKSKSKDFKLFFDYDGHDESNDTTYGKSNIGIPLNPPNWFDDTSNHWGQVMESKITGGQNHESLSDLKSAGRFFYVDAVGESSHSGIVPVDINNSYGVPVCSVLIANKAGKEIAPDSSYVYTPIAIGIDSFGAVIMHEMRHRWQLQQAWGITDGDSEQTLKSKIGRNGTWIFDGTTYDVDADGMKDSWEVAHWGQLAGQPNKFLLNQQYDGNSFEQDNEFDADMNGARIWQIGSVDDQDWANNGKQAE